MSIPAPETAGERAARQRRRLHLGVRELAVKAAVAQASVSKIEAGGVVRVDTLDKVADALGVSRDWLRTGRA